MIQLIAIALVQALELIEALRTRMIAHRTYAGQLERLLAERGVTIPIATQELNPDKPFAPITL